MTEGVSVGICDDVLLWREEITDKVLAYQTEKQIQITIKQYSCAEDYLKAQDDIDILFLDIEMSGMSGIALKDILIQNKRKELWNEYYKLLQPLAEQGCFSLPNIPDFATNNAHMFYLVCQNLNERGKLINKLKEHDILSVFHYLSLHKSHYYIDKHDGRELVNSDKFSDCLVRLPMFYELTKEDIESIVNIIASI